MGGVHVLLSPFSCLLLSSCPLVLLSSCPLVLLSSCPLFLFSSFPLLLFSLSPCRFFGWCEGSLSLFFLGGGEGERRSVSLCFWEGGGGGEGVYLSFFWAERRYLSLLFWVGGRGGGVSLFLVRGEGCLSLFWARVSLSFLGGGVSLFLGGELFFLWEERGALSLFFWEREGRVGKRGGLSRSFGEGLLSLSFGEGLLSLFFGRGSLSLSLFWERRRGEGRRGPSLFFCGVSLFSFGVGLSLPFWVGLSLSFWGLSLFWEVSLSLFWEGGERGRERRGGGGGSLLLGWRGLSLFGEISFFFGRGGLSSVFCDEQSVEV